MMIHHHHFYDKHDQPAILVHGHDFEDVRHLEDSVPEGCPIYWDHEGEDCNGIAEPA